MVADINEIARMAFGLFNTDFIDDANAASAKNQRLTPEPDLPAEKILLKIDPLNRPFV